MADTSNTVVWPTLALFRSTESIRVAQTELGHSSVFVQRSVLLGFLLGLADFTLPTAIYNCLSVATTATLTQSRSRFPRWCLWKLLLLLLLVLQIHTFI